MTESEVFQAFEQLPLPVKMRSAANVIEHARVERFEHRGKKPWPVSDFVAQDLRKLASEWEAEDKAAAERDALVEDFARELYELFEWSGCSGAGWDRLLPEARAIKRQKARRLLDSPRFEVRRRDGDQ